MPIELSLVHFASLLYKEQVSISVGGQDGSNVYRFDVGFGCVMHIEVTCFALSERGTHNIDIKVYRKERLLSKQFFWAPGGFAGALNLGYGVVLTADLVQRNGALVPQWRVRKIIQARNPKKASKEGPRQLKAA